METCISHQNSLPRSYPTSSDVPMSSSHSQGGNPGEITCRLGRLANRTTRIPTCGRLPMSPRPSCIFVKMPDADILVLLFITTSSWQREIAMADRVRGGRGYLSHLGCTLVENAGSTDPDDACVPEWRRPSPTHRSTGRSGVQQIADRRAENELNRAEEQGTPARASGRTKRLHPMTTFRGICHSPCHSPESFQPLGLRPRAMRRTELRRLQ